MVGLKKLNTSIVTLIILFPLIYTSIFLKDVSALAINNPSSNYYLNSTHNFTLTANFTESNIYAVRIKLTVSNATINSFTPTGGWLATIGECVGDTLYTSSEVCVSLAKSTTLTSGDTLGTLNVVFNSLGSVSFVRGDSNGYSDGNIFYPYTGSILTLDVVNEPSTPVEEPDPEEPPVDPNTGNNTNTGTNTGNTSTNTGSTTSNNTNTNNEVVEEDPIEEVTYPLIDDEVETEISGTTDINSSNNNDNNILKIILGINITLIGTAVFFLYRTLRS